VALHISGITKKDIERLVLRSKMMRPEHVEPELEKLQRASCDPNQKSLFRNLRTLELDDRQYGRIRLLEADLLADYCKKASSVVATLERVMAVLLSDQNFDPEEQFEVEEDNEGHFVTILIRSDPDLRITWRVAECVAGFTENDIEHWS